MPPHEFASPPSLFLSRRDTYSFGLFGNVSDADAEIAGGYMDQILEEGYMSVVMSLLFAFLTVMFFMAMRYLLQDGLRLRPNKWMLVAMTLMYICATVNYAFKVLSFEESVRTVTADLTGRYDDEDGGVIAGIAFDGQYIIQGVNVLCGDLVILWRTGVVWHNSTIMRRLNWLFVVLLSLTWIAGIAILATFGMGYLVIPLALSLSVNLWSTSAIGYKTWHRRRMLRQQIFMAGRSHLSAVEHALAVITETGTVYTAIWIIYVTVVAFYFFGGEQLSDVALQRGFQWIWMIMSMLIPLYPTLLILLIARRMTPLTETLTSIDVSTVPPTISAGSVMDIVAFHPVPDSAVEKIGNDLYDPYLDITASSPGAPRSSFPVEPNRRG